ncbi:MAG: hypothetical protein Fur0024_3820 [Patescibacteria group bacterium]
MKSYFVYILTNKTNTVFYIGLTNNLERRIYEHKNKLIDGFTKKYNVYKLVYFEDFGNVKDAIDAEKRMKKWKREWKYNIISKSNPDFKDLLSDWFVGKKQDFSKIEIPHKFFSKILRDDSISVDPDDKDVQKKIEKESIPVYDDYAHHPTQISVTISAFLEKFKKIAVIFESHQYKRTKELFDDFVKSFDKLKNNVGNKDFCSLRGKLFLFPVYKVPGRDVDSDFVDHKILGEKISERGVDVEVCKNYDDLPKVLEKIANEDFDCVLNLGAGPLSGELRKILKKIFQDTSSSG